MKLTEFQCGMAIFLLVVLTGCGGGGTSTPGVPISTLAFPLQAIYKSRIANGTQGSVEQFTVSGSCSGTAGQIISTPGAATQASGQTVSTIFNGVSGLLPASTYLTVVLTNCSPSYIDGNTISFYDSNDNLIGYYIGASGGAKAEYGVVSVSSPIAASVHVGDTATVETINTFTDSTTIYNPDLSTHIGNVATGHQIIGYSIEPDTSTSAIANVTTRRYSKALPTDELVSTQQVRYRITAGGTATVVSIDIHNNLTGIHLLFTKT